MKKIHPASLYFLKVLLMVLSGKKGDRMFGWRKRIGYIAPTVMEVVPYEFYSFAPEGIGLVGVTCNIEDWKPEEYEKGLAMVEKNARYLASRHVDFIIHGGAPLVTNREPGYDKEFVTQLQNATGIASTTSIRSGIESLQHLSLRRVALVTPYPEATNAKVLRFLEHYGFDVVHSACLDIGFKEMQDVPPQEIYRKTVEAMKQAPGAEGVYMPCPQWCVGDVLDVLERDLGVPVVSAITAAFFIAFRQLGVRDEIRGHGRLLAALSETVR
jgi:maleate isomerase